MVRMTMAYNNNVYTLDILKVEDLLFPVLLGRDAPSVGDLLRTTIP